MQRFRWLGLSAIPWSADLRRRGWQLDTEAVRQCAGPADAPGPCLMLLDGTQQTRMRWLLGEGPMCRRRAALVLGVSDPAERAGLLAQGVGDVVGSDATLGEIAARAQRIVRMSAVVPRFRAYASLRLDLLGRDGFVEGKPLGLHPREFALLWRLLEAPGEQVDKAALLRDVWHLSHMPETNSIAVHASRLRRKLACAGLRGLVQTSPSGAYFIATQIGAEGALAAIAPPAGYWPRQDAVPRLVQSG
jgi:hypothetical protein